MSDSPKSPKKSPKKKVKMKGGVKATIEAMDKDGDGKIDLAEYLASGGTEEEFKLLDADGSGQIDASELKANDSVPDDAYALSDEQMQAEYTRLYKKFTQAMLCGKKYDWSYRKCIDIGYKAEALIRETEETDEALFPKMALGEALMLCNNYCSAGDMLPLLCFSATTAFFGCVPFQCVGCLWAVAWVSQARMLLTSYCV